jgi:hypothetical protein
MNVGFNKFIKIPVRETLSGHDQVVSTTSWEGLVLSTNWEEVSKKDCRAETDCSKGYGMEKWEGKVTNERR